MNWKPSRAQVMLGVLGGVFGALAWRDHGPWTWFWVVVAAVLVTFIIDCWVTWRRGH